jgi:SM-20-related protein
VTCLLYLNPESKNWSAHEGCLRLLRGPNDLENFVAEVPPVNGTLLVFPNGPTAWHGHKRFTGQRYSVQLNYMTTDAKARSELRRHRISAFLKRLSRAA